MLATLLCTIEQCCSVPLLLEERHVVMQLPLLLHVFTVDMYHERKVVAQILYVGNPDSKRKLYVMLTRQVQMPVLCKGTV